MRSSLKGYFISGLLFWLPVWVTILFIRFLVEVLDSTLLLLPARFRPDALLGFHLPGIGVVITLAVIFFTGMAVANFLGSRMVAAWHAMMNRIPLVRTVYNGVKQIVDTLFTPGGKAFRKVLLVEFPREGMWSIAFQTGESTPEVDHAVREEKMISLFVPATPNPTSGFLMMMPASRVIELDMGVDQALKFVISLGVVQPGHHNGNGHIIKPVP